MHQESESDTPPEAIQPMIPSPVAASAQGESQEQNAEGNVYKKHRKVATALHPSIAAVIDELWRLPDIDAAIAKISALRENFILSRYQPYSYNEEGTETGIESSPLPPGAKPEDPAARQQFVDFYDALSPAVRRRYGIILWIRGYQVTPEEDEGKYLGNFAFITYRKVMPDPARLTQKVKPYYTLYAIKVPTSLKHHPQKKYEKRPLPNWADPILSSIKKGKTYATPEEPMELLMRLQESYPEVSIPGKDRLFIMTYSREPGKPPAPKKWIFEVKTTEDHRFVIEYRENEKRRKEAEYSPQQTTEEGAAEGGEETQNKEVMGSFTARALLKKTMRKAAKPGLRKKPEEAPADAPYEGESDETGAE
jgi:hypothetical protein